MRNTRYLHDYGLDDPASDSQQVCLLAARCRRVNGWADKAENVRGAMAAVHRAHGLHSPYDSQVLDAAGMPIKLDANELLQRGWLSAFLDMALRKFVGSS